MHTVDINLNHFIAIFMNITSTRLNLYPEAGVSNQLIGNRLPLSNKSVVKVDS